MQKKKQVGLICVGNGNGKEVEEEDEEAEKEEKGSTRPSLTFPFAWNRFFSRTFLSHPQRHTQKPQLHHLPPNGLVDRRQKQRDKRIKELIRWSRLSVAQLCPGTQEQSSVLASKQG